MWMQNGWLSFAAYSFRTKQDKNIIIALLGALNVQYYYFYDFIMSKKWRWRRFEQQACRQVIIITHPSAITCYIHYYVGYMATCTYHHFSMRLSWCLCMCRWEWLPVCQHRRSTLVNVGNGALIKLMRNMFNTCKCVWIKRQHQHEWIGRRKKWQYV